MPIEQLPIASLSYWIAMMATVAFAVTAVLAVAPKGIDLFGVVILAIITAIGGGTLRDVILGVPVFWATDLAYIWVAMGASFVAFWANSLFTQRQIYRSMLYIDGLGVSMFAMQATAKVWGLDFGRPLGPIMLGVVTAIGGGLIRDVLAGRQNLLMKRELYAVPVMLGCTTFVAIMEYFPEHAGAGAFACGLGTFAFRAAAIKWKLSLPAWLATTTKDES